MLSGLREPVNFYTHAIPAIACIPAGAYLIVSSNSALELISSIVLTICFFLLFTSSALYHGIPKNDQEVLFWRKIDHASIYFMIAGTYTPTVVLLFEGWLMWLLLIIVWGIALFGSASKLMGRLKNHKISLALYLAMGWLIVAVIHKMYVLLPIEALLWLFGGGVFYSVGAVFYNLDKKQSAKGYHEIWHLFVVGGAACHYYYTLTFLVG